MDDGCRITFLENSLRTEDFSLALLGRRPAIGEFAWFLAKTHSAMKDSRWGSGMKVARSASAIGVRDERGLKPATTYMPDVVLADVVPGFSPRSSLQFFHTSYDRAYSS